MGPSANEVGARGGGGGVVRPLRRTWAQLRWMSLWIALSFSVAFGYRIMEGCGHGSKRRP